MRPVGSTIRLKCAATGKPPPHILWYKDGMLYSNNPTGEEDESKSVKLTLYHSVVHSPYKKVQTGPLNRFKQNFKSDHRLEIQCNLTNDN